jgi:hypothetical protein
MEFGAMEFGEELLASFDGCWKLLGSHFGIKIESFDCRLAASSSVSARDWLWLFSRRCTFSRQLIWTGNVEIKIRI